MDPAGAASVTRFHRIWRGIRTSPRLPTAIVLFFIIVGVASPYIAPHDPIQVYPGKLFLPPVGLAGSSNQHLLGTDQLGRDLLSRIIIGTRVSLQVAALAALIAGGVGTVVGITLGYMGGIVDKVGSRIVDALLAVPLLLVAILFSVTLGPGLFNLVLAMSILLWARIARVVRGEALRLTQEPFIDAARSMGASDFRIMWRHILPNLFNTVVVVVTLWVGQIITLEASLSFLGAGIPPPNPSWGQMVFDGRRFITSAWWLTILPGLCILAVVVAFNLVGDWIRDVTDPRMRGLRRP